MPSTRATKHAFHLSQRNPFETQRPFIVPVPPYSACEIACHMGKNSIGRMRSSAGCRCGARVSGWHVPALYRRGTTTSTVATKKRNYSYVIKSPGRACSLTWPCYARVAQFLTWQSGHTPHPSSKRALLHGCCCNRHMFSTLSPTEAPTGLTKNEGADRLPFCSKNKKKKTIVNCQRT